MIASQQVAPAWRDANVKPLWEIPQAHGPNPRASAPALWPWRTMRPLIDRAIELATPAVAERRVLSLIDPTARDGEFHTITNLNAGLQVILPGEVARPHRHSADALRFVLEGEGAVTRVDGKLANMAAGDLVLTPGWCWHEHWHEGSGPIVWLDVLNVHTHMNLGTFQFEPGPTHDVPTLAPESAFASAGVVPDMPQSETSPMFRYPIAAARKALESTETTRDGSRRVRYVNPLTGGPVMPYLDCYLVRLEAGQSTRAFQTSAHAVCTIVEGRGTTAAGSTTIAWEPRDVFTLPHGAPIVHTASETTHMFVVTDRELYRRLGFLSESYAE